MPTEGVYVNEAGKKTFIPLENNPEVFTSLIHDLGVSTELEFSDVYSLDDPDLLAFVPRPALALIFITPAPPYYAVRGADGTPLARDGISYDKSGDDEPVMWFRQTIGHACGLIALLHAVANGEARQYVQAGSTLEGLFQKAKSLKPLPRADLLYNSEELEKSHMRAARKGDSSAPRADEACGYHFLTFVKGSDGHLWELEGSTDGPIDRGVLDAGDDMLSEAALEKGVRKFLNASEGNTEFSIIALAKRS